jgi:MIP family channel proteins
MPYLARQAIAEAIGVFTLCFVGITAINNLGPTELSLLGVALAHGLAILIMVAALGHFSGGHFNPAITLGLYLGKKVDGVTAWVYVGAQLLGGMLAALLLVMVDGAAIVANGTPTLAPGVGTAEGITLEAVATFFLVFVVYGTVVNEKAPASVYPIAIGLTITAGILAIGPFTGGALNPARGFGPALVSGEWGGLPSFTIGPLIGGVLAWYVHERIIAPSREDAVTAA